MPNKHKTVQCLHCNANIRSDNLSKHIMRMHQGKGIIEENRSASKCTTNKQCSNSDVEMEQEVGQNDFSFKDANLVEKVDKDAGLNNFELIKLANYLHLPNFRGVFMRDTLPTTSNDKECGIVNLNTSKQEGSHWTAYYKDGTKRIYFDSFGQITPIEVQKYLKTKDEFTKDAAVIERNSDIVQEPNTNICGQLCLYVLDKLWKGTNFQEVIDSMKW